MSGLSVFAQLQHVIKIRGGGSTEHWHDTNGLSGSDPIPVFCTRAHERVGENDAAPTRDKPKPADFFVAALPMNITGGSGGPLRIVARVP